MNSKWELKWCAQQKPLCILCDLLYCTWMNEALDWMCFISGLCRKYYFLWFLISYIVCLAGHGSMTEALSVGILVSHCLQTFKTILRWTDCIFLFYLLVYSFSVMWRVTLAIWLSLCTKPTLEVANVLYIILLFDMNTSNTNSIWPHYDPVFQTFFSFFRSYIFHPDLLRNIHPHHSVYYWVVRQAILRMSQKYTLCLF